MGDYLQYGGQAVIEGVMMRSPHYYAVACRKPDGEIVVRQEAVESLIVGKLKWLNRPFLRGSLALIDAMVMGMRALQYSATVQVDAIEPRNAPDADGKRTTSINDIAVGGAMVMAFVLGLVIFVALPTLLTQVLKTALGITPGTSGTYPQQVMLNTVDGVIRIGMFLAYVWAIARMENIRRVFQYHGAEHKVINTLEAGRTLDVETCQAASRIHPRCGTSFILIVLLASIVVHSLVPRPDAYLVRLALHLALLPVVAGAAYETIRLAGRLRSSAALQYLLAPGLWTQRLTTREPDANQVEVALRALQAVLAREGGEPAPAEPAPRPVGEPAVPVPASYTRTT